MPFTLGKHPAILSRYIRSLRGGSQPILVEASDGATYVVKFIDNLQGSNLPFNEAMGNELYSACGLPVAPWKVLEVTDPFIDQNPACWLETPEGMRRPEAGACFGSLFLGGMGLRVFDILPANWFKRVKNVDDFWMAWLLDVCARHADARQAIFFAGLGGLFRTVFIDFGHMFGGAAGDNPIRPIRASRYLDPGIYPTFDENLLIRIRRIADTLDEGGLRRRLATLPEEWKTDSALENFANCLDSISSSHFLDEKLEVMAEYQQRITCDELYPQCGRQIKNRLLPSGLQSRARDGRSVA